MHMPWVKTGVYVVGRDADSMVVLLGKNQDH